METTAFIPIDLLCRQHGIEVSFFSSLQEYGLIETVTVNETQCIGITQLPEAEKLVRLHEELGINLEGIDVVRNLLERIHEMQNEILALKNRLRLYEMDSSEGMR
ncbi:MAG: chaperone modulator CbpM [Chitinophagaceae bacterium]|nr:chaperone modulator CbpM [Chitinophagaceae bacterium]